MRSNRTKRGNPLCIRVYKAVPRAPRAPLEMTRRCYRDALRVVLVYALLLARAQSTPANSTLNESAVSVAQNGSNTVVVYENNTVIVNNNGNNTINVRIVEYTWTEYAGRVWSDYPGRGYVAAGGAFFLFILIVCMLIVAAYGGSHV